MSNFVFASGSRSRS